MVDYISREAVVDSLDRLCDRVCQYSKRQRKVMCGACPLGDAFTVIEDGIPAADVRPVVLCKECFFYKGDTMFCSLHEADFAKDAFCSYATTNAKAEYWGLGKEGHDRRHDADTREIDDDNTF